MLQIVLSAIPRAFDMPNETCRKIQVDRNIFLSKTSFFPHLLYPVDHKLVNFTFQNLFCHASCKESKGLKKPSDTGIREFYILHKETGYKLFKEVSWEENPAGCI